MKCTRWKKKQNINKNKKQKLKNKITNKKQEGGEGGGEYYLHANKRTMAGLCSTQTPTLAIWAWTPFACSPFTAPSAYWGHSKSTKP